MLAQELISGHFPGAGRSQQPHLAFVPLPSLSFYGKADGCIRRFALLGYAAKGIASEAASIYRTLALILDGEEVCPRYRLKLIPDPHKDKVWSLYNRASRCWVSVTPVALGRGYKVPSRAPDGTPLSNNERHLRRHAEWAQLVRGSLRHIHLPVGVVGSCKVQITASPLFPSTERAEQYRAKDERAPLMHIRLEFSHPVRGPLLVGDRRYQGLGLFVPAERA